MLLSLKSNPQTQKYIYKRVIVYIQAKAKDHSNLFYIFSDNVNHLFRLPRYYHIIVIVYMQAVFIT